VEWQQLNSVKLTDFSWSSGRYCGMICWGSLWVQSSFW
jgi:hypothetical protein